MCVGSVYVLTTECTSLTVTLLVTLRKFASLIFSVMYFRNPFTITHWLGATFVFTGTLLFSGMFPLPSPRQMQETGPDTVALLEKSQETT
jgi:UDP-xylose/UDP-N-acetylglucosamine transporter B4